MAHGHNAAQQSGDVYLPNYRLDKVLGVGSFGKVRIAHHALTGTKVAVKILSLAKIRQMDMEEKVQREIRILKLFRHPHVIRLYEVVKTEGYICLVMEYVRNGELFDYIVEKGRLNETEARSFFQQMVSGIEYCHRNMVVHRDLKPENLLLDDKFNVKIADFGLSNMMRDGHFLKTSCGSPNYAAPEVISGKLYSGPEVDVWSCGVILYALLCGSLPFDDENIPNLFRKIKGGIYTLPPHLSQGSRDLIGRMLVVDPIKRITIQEVKKHYWFVVELPRYLALPPRDSVSQAQAIDEEVLADVVKMGFEREETVQAIKNHITNKSTVIYHLMQDNRKDIKKEYENAPPPQNTVDDKERNTQRIVAPRKWTLGIQMKGQPSSLMSKILALCHQYSIGYKKIAPYLLRCRFTKDDVEVRFEFQLYRIVTGSYLLDIQRIRGSQFTYFALCDLFRKHIETS